MSAATVSFVRALVDHFPELHPLFQEHLDDQENDILPHVFMADVERWLERKAINRQPRAGELVEGILEFLEDEIRSGGTEVANVIHASFLEHLPRPGQPGSEIREMLGPLSAERLRQIG
jgi:hypothetical protein